MNVYWCDVRPLLEEPAPFVRWCEKNQAPLGGYLCLDDALRHFAGLRLVHLARERSGAALHTNVSHSGALAVCALGGVPVGIDVEEILPSSLLPLDYFREDERRWIGAQPQPLRAFYRLWTRKESLIKAERRTLADLLALPSLVENGRLRDQVGGLQVRELDILAGYAASVSAGEIGGVKLTAVPVQRLFPAAQSAPKPMENAP